ncbi:MAG: YbhB/YbcL family Raf kinase inhibitor-like protein, partial [Clostridia bacterium]|nr:YbhB/YbcL family Raf kinase inhibitor-like protein [Clostridia bacterium]
SSLIQGTNSWGKSAYGGMAPPDRPHTYICKVYALDFVPNLKEGFTLDNLQEVMQNHILAECKIEGLYNN